MTERINVDVNQDPPVQRADDLETGSAPEERGGWEFDETVAGAFTDMLERSIPNYAGMRKAVTETTCWLADRWGKSGARVLDLGCSRGDSLRPIVDKLGVRASYLGLEMSQPMISAAQEEFAGWEKHVEIRKHDLRDGLPTRTGPPAAAILSVLTLQFVPIEYRPRLLGEIHEQLATGGGLILVEKVLGSSPRLDALEVDLYYGTKREMGYTQEAIDRKRLSLEGRLVPLTASFNEELLRMAGFRSVDCIWAWANFRAWVALRES